MSSLKFSLIVLVVAASTWWALIARARASDDNRLPTTEEFNGALSACAAGLSITISADLIGSITTLYDGQLTKGTTTFKTQTDFLRSFPEADRAKVYQLYTQCIVQILRGRTAKSEPQPQPLPPGEPQFGLQTFCRDLAPTADVQTILDKFRKKAMASAPVALVKPTNKPVTVSASVGGADDAGALPINSRVRVFCKMDTDFVVIREEHGGHEGIVERSAIRSP
jgi:hypothetical protein